jgi:NADH:ubiquinone oxidoreductase subunit 4 (subunit M)
MRHSLQNEIVVGVPAAKELLPLRLQAPSGTQFHELAAQTAAAYAQVRANSMPLSALVSGLQPAYDDSYAPFFQVAFATILLGFYPAPVLDVTAVSVKKLVSAYEASVRPAPVAP